MRLLIIFIALFGIVALPALPSSAQTIPAPVYLPLVQTSVDPNQGIVFSTPVILENQMAATLATNTNDTRKSFSMKATYKRAGQIAGVVSGYIFGLEPGQTRAILLYSSDDIPTDADTVRVDVDTMYSDEQAGADLAQVIHLGAPFIQDDEFLPKVEIEATNNDSKIYDVGLQMMFLVDGQLVGVGNAMLDDLYPGQTKTATLYVNGAVGQVYNLVIFER